MSSVPTPSVLNLGPNPRRRESFSNSYQPFEPANGTTHAGRPDASHIVVADEAVEDHDDAPISPKAFVRGNRSFSASYPNPGGGKAASRPAVITEQQQQEEPKDDSANMAKSPQEGGWWFGGIKEF
jgi:hypothetical protein